MRFFIAALVLYFFNVQSLAGTEINTFCQNSLIEQIKTYDNELFLLIDGNWIAAQDIMTTSEGLFVSIDGTWMSLDEALGDNYYTWKCRICGYVNPQGVSRCLNYKNHPK